MTLIAPDEPYMGTVTVKTSGAPQDVFYYTWSNLVSYDSSLDCGNLEPNLVRMSKDGVIMTLDTSIVQIVQGQNKLTI